MSEKVVNKVDEDQDERIKRTLINEIKLNFEKLKDQNEKIRKLEGLKW